VGAAGKAVVYQWESGKRQPSPVFWLRIERLERTDPESPFGLPAASAILVAGLLAISACGVNPLAGAPTLLERVCGTAMETREPTV
jgi:hypothetical protein